MKEVNVFFCPFPDKKQLIGRLAQSGKNLFFEYDAGFLADPLWLSPYKLPPKPGLIEHKDQEFGPVFGLFDDSLPDGWGHLLMDRFFRKQGLDPVNISVLDRLSFIGSGGMGALTYEPSKIHDGSYVAVDIKVLAGHSMEVLQGKAKDILPELMRTGGSPGGARPKVLVGIKGTSFIAGQEGIPDGFEHWMIKFQSLDDFSDAGAVEFAYGQMAKAAGIILPPTRIFESEPGIRHFGVKRFDRNGEKRFHVHTFGNMIHSNFRIPACDYETLLKVCLNLTKNHKDLIQCFRQMVFNILVNNRDDHVKNFAFMMDDKMEWRLTPAYDLTFSQGPGGEHSMSIAGEGRSPGKKEIHALGKVTGISSKKVNEIIDRTAMVVKFWPIYAEQAGVCHQTMDLIFSCIKKNLSSL